MRVLKKRVAKKDAEAPRRQLPAPKEMTASLSACLANRKSSREFSDEPVSDEELAAILYAADGINRKDGKRTTPSAMNWQQIDIYVVKANAVWLWKPQENALELVREKDFRGDLCLVQPLLRQAPVHLVYVSNTDRTHDFMTELAMSLIRHAEGSSLAENARTAFERSLVLDAGVKAQSVYLACAALGLRCLLRLTFDSKKVSRALKLTSAQTPVCIQTVGYKPKSILDLAL